MPPVEDTTKLKRRPNFSDGELVVMISMVSDNKIVLLAPLEFFFQEQSYSRHHSGRSLVWDHVRGDIDDPCGAIADFCRVIAVAIPEAIGGRRCVDGVNIVDGVTMFHKTLLNIVKHHETHVKHCDTS